MSITVGVNRTFCGDSARSLPARYGRSAASSINSFGSTGISCSVRTTQPISRCPTSSASSPYALIRKCRSSAAAGRLRSVPSEARVGRSVWRIEGFGVTWYRKTLIVGSVGGSAGGLRVSTLTAMSISGLRL